MSSEKGTVITPARRQASVAPWPAFLLSAVGASGSLRAVARGLKALAGMWSGLAEKLLFWARNKMADRLQPVPGGSTVQVIAGDAAAPGLLDRILARKAYSGQQSDNRTAAY